MNHTFSHRAYTTPAKNRFELLPRGHAYQAVPTSNPHATAASHRYGDSQASDTYTEPRQSIPSRPLPQSRSCFFVFISVFASLFGASTALLLREVYFGSDSKPALMPAQRSYSGPSGRATHSKQILVNDPADTEAVPSLEASETSSLTNDELVFLFSRDAAHGLDESHTTSSFPQWRSVPQGRRSLLLNSQSPSWNSVQILDDLLRVTSYLARETLKRTPLRSEGTAPLLP